MKTPSKEELMDQLDLTHEEDADKIIELAKLESMAGSQLEDLIEDEFPRTWRWARTSFSDPFNNDLWRAITVLHAIDELIGTHGLEKFGRYTFLNMGDMYIPTLMYDYDEDVLFISSEHDLRLMEDRSLF